MITKILLISLALAQVGWAMGLVEDDLCLMLTKYEALLSMDEKLPLPSQLPTYFTHSAVEYFQKYANGAKLVSKQLLQHPEIRDSTSGKTFEFKQNLTKFEENYAKCDGPKALIELVELFSNTTSFYFEDDQTNFDDGDKYILALLKKYNSEKLDSELKKDLDEFAASVVPTFDSLKEDMDKELRKNLTDWLAQYKTLNSLEDKVQAFGQFV